LTGIEIEPPGRLNLPATARSATDAPRAAAVACSAAAPDVDAIAGPAVAAAPPLVVDEVVTVVVFVVVVVVVVVVPGVVVVAVLVGFGTETVGTETVGTETGRVTGSEGIATVVGKSPSAAAVGVCAARRKPSEPAATNAETCTTNRSPDLEPAAFMSPPVDGVTRRCSRSSVAGPANLRDPLVK